MFLGYFYFWGSDLFSGDVPGWLGHHVGIGNLGLAPGILLLLVGLLHLTLHTQSDPV